MIRLPTPSNPSWSKNFYGKTCKKKKKDLPPNVTIRERYKKGAKRRRM